MPKMKFYVVQFWEEEDSWWEDAIVEKKGEEIPDVRFSLESAEEAWKDELSTYGDELKMRLIDSDGNVLKEHCPKCELCEHNEV